MRPCCFHIGTMPFYAVRTPEHVYKPMHGREPKHQRIHRRITKDLLPRSLITAASSPLPHHRSLITALQL